MLQYLQLGSTWFDRRPIDPSSSETTGIGFYVVRGDEELEEFNFKSRTQMKDWAYLTQTPTVFRYGKSPDPKSEPTEHRVNVSQQDAALRALNMYDGKKARVEYLYSAGTALFNRTGFPKLQYLTMGGNTLQGIGIENGFLKFKTLRPNSNVKGITHATHPQFVHKFDIVTYRDGKTLHINTPHGDVFWLLTSEEGVGYIPLKWVRPK